jgi:RNA-directed DNA polymerase
MGSLKLALPETELRVKFFALRTRQDIADLLEVSDYQLRYCLYISSPQRRYKSFQIPKKSGATRQITAPASSLKIIQRKLNQVLQAVYRPKSCTHGFVRQKNILTNAREHVRRRFVLNIDLEDFFASINFGRVRGMFMSPPYKLNPRVATVLAQICCFSNELPQGAPTSPVVSNMICAKMDDQLRAVARKYRCLYTRYADHMTFSTYQFRFPEALAKYNDNIGTLEPGNDVVAVIQANGFKINQSKIKLQTMARRQQVTGLTVNRIVNIRRKIHQSNSSHVACLGKIWPDSY